jgi:hypothetical protein
MVSIVLSVVVLREIKKSGGTLPGRGKALAGLYIRWLLRFYYDFGIWNVRVLFLHDGQRRRV